MRQREEARFSAKKLQFLRALPPSRATRRNGWQSSHARARSVDDGANYSIKPTLISPLHKLKTAESTTKHIKKS